MHAPCHKTLKAGLYAKKAINTVVSSNGVREPRTTKSLPARGLTHSFTRGEMHITRDHTGTFLFVPIIVSIITTGLWHVMKVDQYAFF
jgi:hypothetical protein